MNHHLVDVFFLHEELYENQSKRFSGGVDSHVVVTSESYGVALKLDSYSRSLVRALSKL